MATASGVVPSDGTLLTPDESLLAEDKRRKQFDILNSLECVESIFLHSKLPKEVYISSSTEPTPVQSTKQIPKASPAKNEESNTSENKNIKQDHWEELVQLWKSNENILESDVDLCSSIRELMSKLKPIKEWLSNGIQENGGTVMNGYQWYTNELKEEKISRDGESFVLSERSCINFEGKCTWITPTTRGKVKGGHFAMGARKGSGSLNQRTVPSFISSGEFRRVLDVYEVITKSLRNFLVIREARALQTLCQSQSSKRIEEALQNLKNVLKEELQHNEIIQKKRKEIFVAVTLSNQALTDLKYHVEKDSIFKDEASEVLLMLESSSITLDTLLVDTPRSDSQAFTPTLQEFIDHVVQPDTEKSREHHKRTRILLATLPYFSSPVELFESLIIRYCTPPKTLNTLQEVTSEVRREIRARVMRVFRSWFAKYFQRDFASNPPLIKRAKHFLKYTAAQTGNVIFVRQILRTISESICLVPDVPLPVCNATNINKISFSSKENGKILLDTNPLLLAQQLTCYEFNSFYSCLSEEELSHQCWKKAETTNVLRKYVKHFNDTSGWITRSILAQDFISDRVEAIKRVIVITLHLLGLRNYNGVLEMLGALSGTPIERLKQTWKQLDPEYLYVMATLRSLTHSKMVAFRKIWDQTETSAIPYIGLFLMDLTFTEDGNNTFLDAAKTKINFKKMSQIFRITSVVLKCQSIPYDIEPIDNLQSFFSSLTPVKDNETAQLAWFDRSRLLEPPAATKDIVLTQFECSTDIQDIMSDILQLTKHPLVTVIASDSGTEPGLSIIDIEKILVKMRIEVFTSQKRRKMKLYKDTFMGSNATTWIQDYFSFPTISEATAYGESMLSLGYFVPISPNVKNFRNDETIYRFALACCETDRKKQQKDIPGSPRKRITRINTSSSP